MLRLLLIVTLVTGAWLTVCAQRTDTLRVLFVGNSYTYFWNLPQTVAAMAESQDLPVAIRQSTAGGVNLGQHWRGEKDLDTRNNITTGHYDIVVIQDHSRQAVDHPDSLRQYMQQVIDLVQAQGSRPLLYMTWARQRDPLMIEQIAPAYRNLALSNETLLAPVGEAWQMALTLRPDLPLYDPDGSHPSPSGTYLTACVMYALLFERSPVGLPDRATTLDRHGEKLYLNIQTPEDALFLQKVAQRAVEAAARR
jgi:hypothetical protein